MLVLSGYEYVQSYEVVFSPCAIATLMFCTDPLLANSPY